MAVLDRARRILDHRRRIHMEAAKTLPKPVYAQPGRRFALKKAIAYADQLIALVEAHAGSSGDEPFYAGPRLAGHSDPVTDRQATLRRTLGRLRGMKRDLEAELEATVEPPVPPAGQIAHGRYIEQLRREIDHQCTNRLAAVSQFAERRDWQQLSTWALDAVRLPLQVEHDLNSRR